MSMHLENVEDLYPLAPAQQGILFHALHDPSSSAYFGQLGFTFFENFDEPAFERAWRQLIKRHAVLRSLFVWEGLKEPVQVVRREIELPLERHDWRHLSEDAQQDELHRFLEADRLRGLDLGKAPVMRLILIRLSEDRCRFVWSHHHILLDGWSVPLLLDEFLALYAAPADSGESILPVRRPYRDYISWLAKQDAAKAEAHWRTVLKGFRSPFALGDRIVREGAVEPGVWQRELELDVHLLDGLRELGRTRHVTLNTVVQGAWAILLSRYTGQSDIVYGTTVSGRPPELEGSEQMIGLFINTLPLRVEMNDAMTIDDLLGRIQSQQTETRQFEYSRLVDVQGWSEIPRGSALFDTIFVFENYPVSTGGAGGAGAASPVPAGELTFQQKTNYALTLAVALGKSLVLRCLYDPERIAGQAVARLLQHLRGILESIVERPRQRIGEVDMLSAEERECALDTWNGTSSGLVDGRTIPELFAEQVRANAGLLAVVAEDESLTYGELDERSNQLAHYLRQKGARPEQAVALCLDRGPAMIVGMLAILKAGAAYVPLDGAHPQPRLDYVLADSRATLVVTNSVYAKSLAGAGRAVVQVDADRDAIASCPRTALEGAVSASNLAYIIYTSGSTGRPKGVMVQHRSIANLVRGQARAFQIDAHSRILQFASATFDASVSEIFCALLTGAALHLAGAAALRPGDDLMKLLREREISVLTLPPSLLAVLSEAGLPHLRMLVAAGEACPAGIVSRWAPGRLFLNAYGPTETTVCATVSESLDSGAPVHIGKPLSDTRVYILDPGLRPVPPGVSGELYVAGEPLARGYANQPDLTAERFLPDAFSATPGERMYRTGDRARHRSDGRIEYLGRFDFQVKLRGFRVELGEIESRLESNHAVAKACVIVREDTPANKRLVAYITPRLGLKPEPRDLLAALRTDLPDYMLPSAIVVLEAFPLNSGGKVDRNALPAPAGDRSASTESFVAPRNDTERSIAAIWNEVLQLDIVGVHDNFFDLGGHSLLMLQVHGKLKQAFSKEISMIQMFGYPTIATLAEYFTQSQAQQPARAFASIHERVNRKREALRLAALQEVR